MTKEERKKQSILFTFCILPLVSTDLIARLFPELKYPNKQASKLLKALEAEGFVEGYTRRMGETKVWRLTRKARQQLDIQKRRVPFTIQNMTHYLKVGSAYFDLFETNHLGDFLMEWRYEFISNEKIRRVYAPDAFFIYKQKPYFLEIQQSYLSRMRWNKKWKVAQDFSFEGHLQVSDLPNCAKEHGMPPIITISSQAEEVIKTGARLDVRVFPSMKAFIESNN